ncbi:HIT family protein [Bacillus ndiopicus]|uniref:HIT family protein n=1 Tax=Bacillus ndiopicus TaxID=1347368 RepID=UPI0005A9420A|nr:HIT family protein [Bacillus ndiopicus]
MSEKCFICDKHRGKINTSGITIYEDDYVYVGHIDSNDQLKYIGHIMIDLKRHVPTLGDMTMEEASAFGIIMAKISAALMKLDGVEHVYALVSGNSVPHLHMHLVARYINTPKKYWGPMAVYDWEDAPRGDENEVIELCNRLKIYLEGH